MTTRKHIDIQGVNIHIGPWIHTRPAKQFKFLETNRIAFAITENNYYLDTKTDKVRYHFMDCTNASWKHSYHVYMEVYPGLFAYCAQADENSLTDTLERYSKVYHENDYSNNPAVNEWRKTLARKA